MNTFYFLVVRIPAMATARSATDKEVIIAEVTVRAVASCFAAVFEELS